MSRYANILHTEDESLSDLVDTYQANGRYVLTREQALAELLISRETLKKAVQRLAAKHRIAVPRRGFFVIVPVEYRDAGAPPPAWFIDDLMKFLNRLYYVGLLSAAAIYGAAHQQPQEFQVITNKQLRMVTAGRARIRFFQKHSINRTPTVEMKTETGTMRVGTPEATALDLLRYVQAAGHLGNVVTVLSELAEQMNADRLVQAARAEDDLPNAQRLGHLLDQLGAGEIVGSLAAWIEKRHPRFVPLRPDRPTEQACKDVRWHVIVNEEFESET